MSPVERLAWFGGTWMAIGIAAAWIKHRLRRPPLPQRTPTDVNRDVDNYRAARIAEVNQRLRRGAPAPQRPVTLADIQALDNQLTDLDEIANRIQPLYVREEGK